jgi:hypothetical protein
MRRRFATVLGGDQPILQFHSVMGSLQTIEPGSTPGVPVGGAYEPRSVPGNRSHQAHSSRAARQRQPAATKAGDAYTRRSSELINPVGETIQ